MNFYFDRLADPSSLWTLRESGGDPKCIFSTLKTYQINFEFQDAPIGIELSFQGHGRTERCGS